MKLEAVIEAMFRPRRFERPASAPPPWSQQGTIETERGAIPYWRAGEGTQSVLLVHGWEGTHADLDAFVEPLVAHGYRVIAFDNYAHGENAAQTATLFDMAQGVRAVGDDAGELRGIIAHSVGGPASAIALDAGLATERIALIATPTYYGDFVRGYAEATGIAPDVLLAALAERGFALGDTLPDIAARLDVPALLVHSSDDRVTSPSGSERVAAAWRGSRLILTNGLGHNRILRDPDTIAAVVGFIAA
jgi:pimeloyl-ACP methyl ester carboxylesterase